VDDAGHGEGDDGWGGAVAVLVEPPTLAAEGVETVLAGRAVAGSADARTEVVDSGAPELLGTPAVSDVAPPPQPPRTRPTPQVAPTTARRRGRWVAGIIFFYASIGRIVPRQGTGILAR
jgi:hypothetical protein